MQTLLTDSKIAEAVYENEKDKEKYKICTIQSNGTVVMGKTSVSWWNKLLNCQDKLPFESFALKVWDALVDLSSGLNNKAITEGLSREIVINSVRNKDYNWVVSRLFDCWTHVAQLSEGYQEPASPAGGQGVVPQGREKVIITERNDEPKQIVLNVNGKPRVIPFIDSVGDQLNLGLEVGITGIRQLY